MFNISIKSVLIQLTFRTSYNGVTLFLESSKMLSTCIFPKMTFTYLLNFKSTGRFGQFFVAFLEKMNFKREFDPKIILSHCSSSRVSHVHWLVLLLMMLSGIEYRSSRTEEPFQELNKKSVALKRILARIPEEISDRKTFLETIKWVFRNFFDISLLPSFTNLIIFQLSMFKFHSMFWNKKIMRIHQLKMLILLKNNFDGLEWKNIWYFYFRNYIWSKFFFLIIEFLLFFPGKLPVPLKSYWTQSTKSPLTFPAHLANKPWIRKNVNLSSIPKGFPIPSKSSSEMDSKSIHLLFTPLSGFHCTIFFCSLHYLTSFW